MERSAKRNSLIAKVLKGFFKTPDWLVRKLPPIQRELMRRAMWLAILYGVAQVAGLREWTSALLKGSAASTLERVLCMVYLLLYGSFVFVVPILVIATLLLIAFDSLGHIAGQRKRNRI